MSSLTLLFPHQLFEFNPALQTGRKVLLVEEPLFFNQYNFHFQKRVFHRATMKFYETFLVQKGFEVEYIETANRNADVRKLIPWLKSRDIKEIHYIDLVDNWLGKRLRNSAQKKQLSLVEYESPMFLNSPETLVHYFVRNKKFRQTDFYTDQRKKRRILTESDQPVGGKWTFDTENRRKYPASKQPPEIQWPDENAFYKEARQYVEKHFSCAYGEKNNIYNYPSTFEESREWLDRFLEHRLQDFGAYEDAMVYKEHVLHHSLLSPLLNVGLITPDEVIEKTVAFYNQHHPPVNSVEGFLRQIMGWREFIRALYILKGSEMRTQNFWGFNRKIPPSFWKGTTGIEPVDLTIRKVLKTGYCHHIERLMVLGNFMLLCEFDPKEVYRWFMELFIDAYDWVMVPNVYGMSQFSAGNIMTTKPYISAGNYLRRMSDFPKGDWQIIWDALFWRFMHVHRSFFAENPRLAMLVKTLDSMSVAKKKGYRDNAERFLKGLDK